MFKAGLKVKCCRVLLLPALLALIIAAGCAQEHRVTLEAEPQEAGRVEGAGTYESGQEAQVKAEPGEGYVFAGWEEDGDVVSTETGFSFKVTADRKLVARFEEADPARLKVALYFGNREAIESGVTTEYGYVKPVYRELDDPRDPEALLREALEQLFAGPGEEDEGCLPVVHDTVEILQVAIDPATGLAEVDLSDEMFGEKWPGGSLSGMVFVQAVTWTAVQFPEVEALIVTVEQEVWDDGHTRWEEPLALEEGMEDLAATGL